MLYLLRDNDAQVLGSFYPLGVGGGVRGLEWQPPPSLLTANGSPWLEANFPKRRACMRPSPLYPILFPPHWRLPNIEMGKLEITFYFTARDSLEKDSG